MPRIDWPNLSASINGIVDVEKKGMTKFTVVDISFCFLAHKNAQDKLLDEFSEDNFRLVEILDRTCQGAQCHTNSCLADMAEKSEPYVGAVSEAGQGRGCAVEEI